MINRMISSDSDFVGYKLVKCANLDMDIENSIIILVIKYISLEEYIEHNWSSKNVIT